MIDGGGRSDNVGPLYQLIPHLKFITPEMEIRPILHIYSGLEVVRGGDILHVGIAYVYTVYGYVDYSIQKVHKKVDF